MRTLPPFYIKCARVEEVLFVVYEAMLQATFSKHKGNADCFLSISLAALKCIFYSLSKTDFASKGRER